MSLKRSRLSSSGVKLVFSIKTAQITAFRCSSVIYAHLLLSPSYFQNSLSTFSTERVNGIPLWDFYVSDFQRVLKIVIIAELFIVTTISLGTLRHNNSDNAENVHSRSYVLKSQMTRISLNIPYFLE